MPVIQRTQRLAATPPTAMDGKRFADGTLCASGQFVGPVHCKRGFRVMEPRPGGRRLRPAWWMLIMLVTVALSLAPFERSFSPDIPVTVTSDRSGPVMETGAKVKLRGVQVGTVSSISRNPIR
jgi:hypothetical protein